MAAVQYNQGIEHCGVAVVFFVHVREVFGSNRGQDTECPD
jgi:hypothetical protein